MFENSLVGNKIGSVKSTFKKTLQVRQITYKKCELKLIAVFPSPLFHVFLDVAKKVAFLRNGIQCYNDLG